MSSREEAASAGADAAPRVLHAGVMYVMHVTDRACPRRVAAKAAAAVAGLGLSSDDRTAAD